MWNLPEYVAELIRDEDCLTILRKVQRSRPFWEITGTSFEAGQARVVRQVQTRDQTVGYRVLAHPTPTP